MTVTHTLVLSSISIHCLLFLQYICNSWYQYYVIDDSLPQKNSNINILGNIHWLHNSWSPWMYFVCAPGKQHSKRRTSIIVFILVAIGSLSPLFITVWWSESVRLKFMEHMIFSFLNPLFMPMVCHAMQRSRYVWTWRSDKQGTPTITWHKNSVIWIWVAKTNLYSTSHTCVLGKPNSSILHIIHMYAWEILHILYMHVCWVNHTLITVLCHNVQA